MTIVKRHIRKRKGKAVKVRTHSRKQGKNYSFLYASTNRELLKKYAKKRVDQKTIQTGYTRENQALPQLVESTGITPQEVLQFVNPNQAIKEMESKGVHFAPTHYINKKGIRKKVSPEIYQQAATENKIQLMKAFLDKDYDKAFELLPRGGKISANLLTNIANIDDISDHRGSNKIVKGRFKPSGGGSGIAPDKRSEYKAYTKLLNLGDQASTDAERAKYYADADEYKQSKGL